MPDQGGAGFRQDERAVRERCGLGIITALRKATRNSAGGMQKGVEFGDGAGMPGGMEKGSVGSSAAFAAGAMASGEGDSLVMEEQFRVVPRDHERAFTALETGQAADPCLVTPAAAGQAMFIVQDATIAHESPARGVCDDLRGRLNAVLEGHGTIVRDAGG